MLLMLLRPCDCHDWSLQASGFESALGKLHDISRAYNRSEDVQLHKYSDVVLHRIDGMEHATSCSGSVQSAVPLNRSCPASAATNRVKQIGQTYKPAYGSKEHFLRQVASSRTRWVMLFDWNMDLGSSRMSKNTPCTLNTLMELWYSCTTPKKTP